MLILAAACSGGGSGNGAGGALGPGFVVEGADLSVLCPNPTALAGGFTLSGQGVADNEVAAQRVADPQRRLAEYESWGRVTGYFSQWTYVSPSALTEEELSRMTEEEAAAARERARQEALANPFLAATCSVELYENTDGAHQAFSVQAAEARNPSGDAASGDAPGVSEHPDPKVGDESIKIVYRYPTFSMFVITFRARNVIGSVSVVAGVTDETADYAETLVTPFTERIDDALEVAG